MVSRLPGYRKLVEGFLNEALLFWNVSERFSFDHRPKPSRFKPYPYPKRTPMTKKDMAKAIAEEVGLTQEQTREVVQRVFDGIIETLITEGRIELRNFGVFEVKKRKPRKARNPRTGESLMVPAKAVVTFKQGHEIGEKLKKVVA